MSSPNLLPPGWCEAKLPDVAQVNPTLPDIRPDDETRVSFIPMASVEALTGRMDTSDVRLWRDVKKGYTRFQEGDLLFAKITPCMENGKAAIARGLPSGAGVGSTEFHVLRPGPALQPEFLLYYVLQEEFRKAARSEMTGTAGQLRVPTRFLDRQTIPLSPLSEQHRIVAAIESYFTRLDEAVVSLERVQRNLKRNRASVLKAAVEGRLVPTEAELARAEGRSYEPASVLLVRILAERRRRWEEAELAKMKAKGKVPKDDRWRAKYVEPTAPEDSFLPTLPEGWSWVTVDQLAYDVRYGSSAKTDADLTTGVPALRMGNISGGLISYSDLKYLPRDHSEFPDLLLKSGDLLFNRTNSAELVGKTAVFLGHGIPCSFASYLIRVRFVSSIEPMYVAHCINSVAGRLWIAAVVSQQVGQANVNGTKLRACPIPLPPSSEQVRIVREADRQLSLISRLAVECLGGQSRCARLRQSILKCAFKGRLVDQDPTDEPASRLLERILAERQSASDKPPFRLRRPRAKKKDRT